MAQTTSIVEWMRTKALAQCTQIQEQFGIGKVDGQRNARKPQNGDDGSVGLP
jgi:hypothetical protein